MKFVLSFFCSVFFLIFATNPALSYSNNYAVDFAANNGYGQFDSTADNVFDIGDGSSEVSVSIASWINLDTVSGRHEIFAFHTPNSNLSANRKYTLYVFNGALWLAVGDGTNYARCSHSGTLVASTDYHIVGTYDASNDSFTLWINGDSVTRSSSVSTGCATSAWDIRIDTDTSDIPLVGAYSGTSFYNRIDGRVDDLAVWSTVLSDSDVQSIYRDGQGVANVQTALPTNLLAYWNFNQTTGTTVNDQTSNNVHMTLSGTTSFVASSWDTTPTAAFSPVNGATGVSASASLSLTFSAGVRQSDNSELTSGDLSSYIVLRDTNASGTAIAFSASINSDKDTITVSPTSSFASNQTVYFAFTSGLERSDNAITASSSTFTVETFTSPTITIEAAEVSNGATSDDASLSMTFTTSAATSDFTASDISVTNGAISGFTSISSTVYQASFTPTSEGTTTIDVAANSFTDSGAKPNLAAVQFTWTYSVALPTPLAKKDVMGALQTWQSDAQRVANMVVFSVDQRLHWLRAKQPNSSSNTSYQGISFEFANEDWQTVVFGQAQERDILALNHIKQVGEDQDKGVEFTSRDAQSISKEQAFNEILHLKETELGSLKPQFASDSQISGWSWWTYGSVTIGELDGKDTNSTNLNAEHISVGLDKMIDNSSVTGFAFSVGQGNSDFKASKSAIENESISFTIYNESHLSQNVTLRSILGSSLIKFDNTRYDGAERLVGKRDAQQVNASMEVREIGQLPAMNHPTNLEYFIKADASATHFDAFTEQGGSLALHYENQNIKTAHLSVGLDVRSDILFGSSNVKPYLGVEYSANFSPDTRAKMRYASEDTIYQYERKRYYASQWKTDLGAEYNADKFNIVFAISHEEQINSGTFNSASLGLSWSF